jgi:hypothetical protein
LETKIYIWEALMESIYFYSKIILYSNQRNIKEIESLYIRTLKTILGVPINTKTEDFKNLL